MDQICNLRVGIFYEKEMESNASSTEKPMLRKKQEYHQMNFFGCLVLSMAIYSLMGSIFQCWFSITYQPGPDSGYLVKLAYQSAKYCDKTFCESSYQLNTYNNECNFSFNSVLI
jgi:hypothetical protein